MWLNEALRMAAARGNADLVKLFLTKGANGNQKDSNRRSTLHRVTFSGPEEVVQYLVGKGVNFFLEDGICATPIDLAVRKGLKALFFLTAMHNGVLSFN